MDVFEKYVKHYPRYLTQHALHSYEHFITHGIRKAIMEKEHPVRILKKKDSSSKEFTHKVYLYFGGKDGTKYYIDKTTAFPNICRLEGLDYSATLKVKVFVEIIENDEILSEQEFDIDLLQLPIMLHSSKCALNGFSFDKLLAAGECPYEQGGYFIVGGLEKVIMTQERTMSNKIYIVESPDDTPFTWKAYIQSSEENAAQKPQTTYLKRHHTTGTLWILVPFIKKMIPVCVLFRALGIETDKEIVRIVCGNGDTESGKLLASLLKPSLDEGGYLYTQESALRFLATLTKVQPEKGNVKWKENILYILIRRLFPHSNHEKSKLLHKAFFLAHMVRTFLLTQHKYIPPLDRDSLSQRQFAVAGELISELFRDFYSEYIDTLRSRLYQRFEYKKEYREKFKNILIPANASPIFNSRIFQDNMNKSFRGRWGKNPNLDENLGVIQDLQRLSFLGSQSHLRRTHLFLPPSAKLVEPRRLHSSQWGYICPIETPDGGNVSLLKHLSIMAHVSPELSSKELYPLLSKIGMVSLKDMTYDLIHIAHKVFINGHWAGVVPDNTNDFVRVLKQLRRTGVIHYTISIAWKISFREIHICTQSGRLLRPVALKTLKSLKKKSWKELTNMHTTGTVNKTIDVTPEFLEKTKSSLCHIEFVDAAESDTLYINTAPSIEKGDRFTHCELHPSLLLGVTALTIPFLEHNPSPRNLFAVGQGKQAVSTYLTNYKRRLDQTASVLFYGQKPLVHTGYLDILDQNKHTYGINTIVAIGAFSGYNQEDSILVNRSSLNRGMFLSSYTKTHLLREEYAHGTVLEICNPLTSSRNVQKLRPGFDYSALDENGIIRPNTPVKANTILIGGCSLNDQNEWIDASLAYGMAHDHDVVRTVYLSPYEQSTNQSTSLLGHAPRVAKVMTHELRVPQIGDKFATRSAQKGTIGLVVDSWDMPYTEDGIVPDIVINPHAFPSRMTMGYFLEMLSGLYGIETGMRFGVSAFHATPSLDSLLLKTLKNLGLEKQGEYTMFSGLTGKTMSARVCMGPMFYQRLKQMVADKMYARGSGGPKDMLTQQPQHGRARGGGLRNGEMERDVLLSHGIAQFARETYFERSDAYQTFIDTHTGDFVPPDTKNSTKIQIPYAFKLLKQEAQTMGVKMKLDT